MESLKNVNLTVVLCVALVCGTGGYVALQFKPTANPGVPVVSNDFAAVRAIAAANPAKARIVGKAFADLAWVHERDEACKTTGQLRQQIVRFEALLWAKTEMANALPGFSAAANAGMTAALGLEDAPLDKAKSVAALKALSQACGS